MRIIILPLAVPDGAKEPGTGSLTRAIPRELAARLALADGVEALFHPFAHMVEGRRVFGVYEARWPAEDIHRLAPSLPDHDLLVQGELALGDPFRIALEVRGAPSLAVVAEETFEAPRFDGFRVIDEAAKFLLDRAGAKEGAEGAFPARTFEGWLALISGREAAATVDGWGEPAEPEELFEPFFVALEKEPRMKAAEEELCLFAAGAAAGGLLPREACEAALERLTRTVKKSWPAWASLGQALGARGEFGRAEDCYKKALEIDPGRAALRFDLGMTLIAQGRLGRAAKVLETVKTDPHAGAAAHYELGRIREAKSDLPGAVAHYRDSVAADARTAEVFAAMGRAHAAQGEFDEAEKAFRGGLECEIPSGDLHEGYGVWLSEQGRMKEAMRELEIALRLLGTSAEAHLHFGHCLGAGGEKVKALHHLRKAVRAEGEIGERAREEIGELTSVEHEERVLGMLDEALARPAEEQVPLLRGLLKEESSHPEARIRLGLALVATGKGRAAEGTFRKVLKQVPQDAEAWAGLATALRLRGKYKAAERAHRESIKRAPNFAGFRLNLADTLLRLGRAPEAAKEVELARALDPANELLPGYMQGVKLALTEAEKPTERRRDKNRRLPD